ncbi:MAG: PLP-dependent aspartate aminotransferase family protein [Lachnospiraceae bacterium]|nr:PLP-dependent aspartate aminotransferase family protein [Lachnospiraceae bacterium]
MKNFSNYNDYSTKEELHFASKAVHGALGTEPITGAVSMPIFQTATFRHPELGQSTGFAYSRLANPTRQELERTMAILEGGIQGFAFSSGQAANMAVFSLLNPGEHVILSDDIYGGTFRIIGDVFGKYGIEHTYVDMSDLDAVRAAIRPETKMIFVETPTNPMMKVADIAAVSSIAKEIGALTVVDNTFLTPYFQRPLALGADIVTHSSTKYLGGHNDTISGIVVVKDDQEIANKILVHIKSHGSQLAPMDCWLVLRGIKTLAVRMDRHNENAKKVAAWLRTQPKVKEVFYVGFEDHKDYDVTCRQTEGFGGMISFTVDSVDTVKKILKNVDMIMFAESLGGTETLITYPTTQTHEDTPKDIKDQLGITDCFLRMSVGIEDVDDIIADLDRAMNA